jgi:hypothetical protein
MMAVWARHGAKKGTRPIGHTLLLTPLEPGIPSTGPSRFRRAGLGAPQTVSSANRVCI